MFASLSKMNIFLIIEVFALGYIISTAILFLLLHLGAVIFKIEPRKYINTFKISVLSSIPIVFLYFLPLINFVIGGVVSMIYMMKYHGTTFSKAARVAALIYVFLFVVAIIFIILGHNYFNFAK